MVIGIDQAQQIFESDLLEAPVHGRSGGLGGVAASPPGAAQQIPNLSPRPLGRVDDAGAPDEVATAAFFDGPLPIAAQRPVPQPAGNRTPRLLEGRHPSIPDEA